MTATISPTDLLETLSGDQKDELFLAMVRQFAVNVKGDNVVPLWDGGTLLGFFVHPRSPEAGRLFPAESPSAEHQEMLSRLPPEVAAMTQPIPEDLDWNDVLTREDLRKIRQEVLSRSPG